MGWSTPRTWVADEVVTAAIMNTHIRDQLDVLKVTRDPQGRITDLSSSTVASLASANLLDVAFVNAGNDFTAGKKRFTADARLVVPVGADKYEDLGGGLRRGLWVEGDYLHHIASDQTTEWRYAGEYVSTPAGALSGSLWVEGEYLHYIDADGDERRCQSLGGSGHNDAAVDPGSLWIETYQHIIREAGSLERPVHQDVPHSDGTPHVDTAPHADSPHEDSPHEDVPFDDEHDDVPHDDTPHYDHSDHIDHDDDIHVDLTPHGDAPFADSPHEDHDDAVAPHEDTPHEDNPHDDTPHTDHDDHGDAAFVDQPTEVT